MGKLLNISDLVILKENLNKLGDYLIIELAKELTDQGHRATGSLIDSISKSVSVKFDQILLDIEYLRYGQAVETGVKASKVPYSRGSGAKTSLYIDALIRWVKVKGIATEDSKAKNIAYAIANTHKKDTHNGFGIPTKGSFEYSSNGRRLGFQSHVISNNLSEIEEQISESLNRQINQSIDQILNKIVA